MPGQNLVEVALLSRTSIWASSNMFWSRPMSGAGVIPSIFLYMGQRSTVSYTNFISKMAKNGMVR